MRIALLTLCFITLFVAIASLAYFVIGFALWVFVFGDDSTTFGYYALALAIPTSLLLSSLYIGVAVRWSVGSPVLIGTIVTAVICEALFVLALRS